MNRFICRGTEGGPRRVLALLPGSSGLNMRCVLERVIGFGLEVSRLCTGAERQLKLALRLSNRVFSWRDVIDKIDGWG